MLLQHPYRLPEKTIVFITAGRPVMFWLVWLVLVRPRHGDGHLWRGAGFVRVSLFTFSLEFGDCMSMWLQVDFFYCSVVVGMLYVGVVAGRCDFKPFIVIPVVFDVFYVDAFAGGGAVET